MTEQTIEPTVDTAGFRSMMAGFPSGVAIVTTTGSQGVPWGMTCSSLCSVSVDPPTLLVCLREGGPTLRATLRRRAFTVNVLHDAARPAAELFASGAPDRFDRVDWTEPAGAGGPHLPADARAIADCRLTRTEAVNDHVVVFGEVLRVASVSTRLPLLYGLRRYASWPEA